MWVKDLFAAWRGERIVLFSPIPIDVLRRWLSGNPSHGAYDVIRRSAAKLNTRSPWRPVLRGRLLRADSGSQFVGVLGWDPVLKVFTCCVLGAFAGVFVAGVALAVFSAGNDGRPTAGAAMFSIAFGLFGVVGGLVSIVVGYRETRGQTAYLRSWIKGQMDAPWYRGPQPYDD